MKVLFLDLDGVVNTAESRIKKGLSYYSDIVDEDKLELVKEIVCKTQCAIVLTSSWRKYWNQKGPQVDSAGKAIQNAFTNKGLAIYSKTPVVENAFRSQEIDSWLKYYGPIDQYVIIDDKDFMWTDDQRAHFVMTDGDCVGLTVELAQVAIHVLQGHLLPVAKTKQKEKWHKQIWSKLTGLWNN